MSEPVDRKASEERRYDASASPRPEEKPAPSRHLLENFDEGEEMPYHHPRGPVVGSRRGVYLTEGLVVLLFGLLVAALVFMILYNRAHHGV